MRYLYPNVPLTDRLGNELDPGDTVLVPVRNRSYLGGGMLVEGVIQKIDILIEDPNTWLSTGPGSRIPFYREEQLGHKRAPEFFPPVDPTTGVVDHSKASVLSIQVRQSPRDSPVPATVSCRYNDCVKVR